MELTVFKTDGSATQRTVALDPQVFGVEPNDHAIWLDVRSAQASARQGTHKAKERSDVRGGGQKPWRQKGTGRARVGTIRSPLWVGGGTTFGPRPRTYNVRVNRKTKALARRSVLSYRAQADAIRVVEDFSLDVPKTRAIADLLAALELAGEKVLLLTGGPDANLYKSGRNIPKVNVRDAASASTLDLMNAGVIVLLEGALEALSNVLGSNGEQAGDASDSTADSDSTAATADAPAAKPVTLQPEAAPAEKTTAEPVDAEAEASEPVTMQPEAAPAEEITTDEAAADEPAAAAAAADEPAAAADQPDAEDAADEAADEADEDPKENA